MTGPAKRQWKPEREAFEDRTSSTRSREKPLMPMISVKSTLAFLGDCREQNIVVVTAQKSCCAKRIACPVSQRLRVDDGHQAVDGPDLVG